MRRHARPRSRLESPPVWLPVTGVLMVEPLGEVVADHQVRHDRRGVITEHRREAGLRQDVREGAEVTDRGLEISGDASVLQRVLPPPVAA